MANLANIADIPVPSTEKGQRSIPIADAYFARIIPSWSQPSLLTPDQWRAWVKSQPIAVTCKETMKSNILDLGWKITPRESDKRDELKGTVRHYENLLQHGGGSMDWSTMIELILDDLLDLPFGAAWEVGRKDDNPTGRVMWLKPMDGGTCYPTNNDDFPVYQYFNGFDATMPQYAVARTYMNPHPDIVKSGWGTAPPELIFRAMEMIARGDGYYANLLLDIPPVGVFDLGDITWEDAHTWIQSFRSSMTGAGAGDAFRIPVLAEHTGKVEFIPLGKAPNDIMYDRITLKYASLVCAGYGMNLGDIGVQSASSSGETLAGSIRGEQKTNRTGKARVKAKLKYFVESFLPDTLQFDFIDTDGERLSMLGRARLANATAFNQLRQMGAISPEEARLQAIQDGLMTISMPEKPPKEATPPPPASPFGAPATGKKPPERPASVGSPQPPSMGGDGEVKKSLDEAIERIASIIVPNVQEAVLNSNEDDPSVTRAEVLDAFFENEEMEDALGKIVGEIEGKDEKFSAFLGKAIVYNLVNSDHLFDDVVADVQSKTNIDDYINAFTGELGELGESNG